jgi:hypothetical protein
MIYAFKLQSTAVGLVLLLILVVTLFVVSTLLFRTHHFVVTDRAITCSMPPGGDRPFPAGSANAIHATFISAAEHRGVGIVRAGQHQILGALAVP